MSIRRKNFNCYTLIMNVKAVIFDMDGTLTEHNSWFEFSRALGVPVKDHATVYKDAVGGKISLDRSKRLLLDMWRKSENANEAYINELFSSWEAKKDAKYVVDWLKSKGYKTCIISGSLRQCAEATANKLDIDYFYTSSELHYDSNGLLNEFDYVIDQASAKLDHLKQFCKENNLFVNECIVVGDGDNDISLFEATKRGIFVETKYSSEQLRSLAWKSVTQLREITDIIAMV